MGDVDVASFDACAHGHSLAQSFQISGALQLSKALFLTGNFAILALDHLAFTRARYDAPLLADRVVQACLGSVILGVVPLSVSGSSTSFVKAGETLLPCH